MNFQPTPLLLKPNIYQFSKTLLTPQLLRPPCIKHLRVFLLQKVTSTTESILLSVCVAACTCQISLLQMSKYSIILKTIGYLRIYKPGFFIL